MSSTPVLAQEPIHATISSGVNHGREALVKAWSQRHGGFLVEFDGEVRQRNVDNLLMKKLSQTNKHAKRYYSLNRLTFNTHSDLYRALLLTPATPKRDRLIVQAAARRLQGFDQRVDLDRSKMQAMYESIMDLPQRSEEDHP